MTLTEFLRARLDEDERWAREASRLHYGGDVVQAGVHWRWVCGRIDEVLTVDPMLGEFLECSDECVSAELRSIEEYPTSGSRGLPQMPMPGSEEVDPSVAGHIARHDPARVLAEVDAKRRIVDAVMGEMPGRGDRTELRHRILRLLALPYADHPDYDESWKP